MKKYILVGTGHRAHIMFAEPMTTELKDKVSLKGVYDINPLRAKYFAQRFGVEQYFDFEKMLDEVKPAAVIVTTTDCTHHTYVIRALQKGYDVLCEKPLTTEPKLCKDIEKAEKQSGKSVTVTFNCRFMPLYSCVKRLIAEKGLGRVLALNYEYLLGDKHGADYFRRWHRYMKNSGGLLVHKSTHHFDIANWIIADEPVSVSAQGLRSCFGDAGAFRGERCLSCVHAKKCPYYWDINESDFYTDLYAKTESADGYIRDRCVFGNDIDIFDQMAVSVRYKQGALLTYSLSLKQAYEGYKLSVSCENGRIEALESDLENSDTPYILKVCTDSGIEEIKVPRNSGTHGGGDSQLREVVLLNAADDLGRKANLHDGITAVLMGCAANKSITENKTIFINTLKS